VTFSLGSNNALGVKEQTAERVSRFANWYTDKFSLMYKKKDLEFLSEKIAICVEIMRGIYARSMSIQGELTDFYHEESRIVLLNYLNGYFEPLDK